MAKVTREAEITNEFGLHARPAMQLVELASSFQSMVEVSNGTLNVDAKSIMSVMRLAATKGAKLTITADGQDAEEACQAIGNLIDQGFGQPEPGQDTDDADGSTS